MRSTSRVTALVSMFTALGVALRVSKNMITNLQFVNFPLLFAFTAAFLAGPRAGLITGAAIYLFSDLLILPGAWTVTNMLLGGLVAAAFGLASRALRHFEQRFVLAFLLCFVFDVASSALLYAVFGVPLLQAVLVGFVGLFSPVMGGYLIGVGPLTEFTTAILAAVIVSKLERYSCCIYENV